MPSTSAKFAVICDSREFWNALVRICKQYNVFAFNNHEIITRSRDRIIHRDYL